MDKPRSADARHKAALAGNPWLFIHLARASFARLAFYGLQLGIGAINGIRPFIALPPLSA
jgi:hypothetical protein